MYIQVLLICLNGNIPNCFSYKAPSRERRQLLFAIHYIYITLDKEIIVRGRGRGGGK